MIGVRTDQYRLVPEDRMVEEIALFHWPYELRAGPTAPVLAQARAALERWIALGLPYRERGGARLFDKCEVHNFSRLLGLRQQDPTWLAHNVASHRRLVSTFDVEAHAVAARFDVCFRRDINVGPIADGTRLRLELPLPPAGDGQSEIDVAVTATAGGRVQVAGDRAVVRAAREPGQDRISIEARIQLTARWQRGPLDHAAAAGPPPPDVDRFLARRERLIEITPTIEQLARRLGAGVSAPAAITERLWEFLFTSMKVGYIHHDDLDPRDPLRSLLELGWTDCYAGSALLVALSRACGIPSRIVHGVLLYPTAPGTHYWVESWIGSRWVSFDLAGWNLSGGDPRDMWARRFFGALDYRMTLQRYPTFGGHPGFPVSETYYRVETPTRRGVAIGYHDRETEQLNYSDSVEVLDWHLVGD